MNSCLCGSAENLHGREHVCMVVYVSVGSCIDVSVWKCLNVCEVEEKNVYGRV